VTASMSFVNERGIDDGKYRQRREEDSLVRVLHQRGREGGRL
jgi:hypothetical protein